MVVLMEGSKETRLEVGKSVRGKHFLIQVNKDEAWIEWGKKRGLLGKEMDMTQSYPLLSRL